MAADPYICVHTPYAASRTVAPIPSKDSSRMGIHARVRGGIREDEHSADMTALRLGPTFAHGAHSALCLSAYGDEEVAVKITTARDKGKKGQYEKEFGREVRFLSSLRHPNVVKFVAAREMWPYYFVITEYFPEGSLRAYLHRLENKPIPLQNIVRMALDVARGMEYIHAHGVVHRDLKPENVLVDLVDHEFHRLKISDFGSACEEAYRDSDYPGTYGWMAPEIIGKKSSWGRKVDVFSFAMILWELVAGRVPFEGMDPVQSALAVLNNNLRPVIPGDCPHAMRTLIEQRWHMKPEQRPEFRRIVKVLEHFEYSLALDGTLDTVSDPIFHHHKRTLLHWIWKHGHAHTSGRLPLACG